MTEVPVWLLVAALILGMLGSIAGITGAALGIRNEIRRRRENKPDVTVRWEDQQYSDDARRAWIVVTNQGHVAVSIVDALRKITGSSEEEVTSRRGMMSVRDVLPFRLEPRDQKIIQVTPPFMFAGLEPGEYDVVVTMVDGLGNHYDSVPFSVVQPEKPDRRTPI